VRLVRFYFPAAHYFGETSCTRQEDPQPDKMLGVFRAAAWSIFVLHIFGYAGIKFEL